MCESKPKSRYDGGAGPRSVDGMDAVIGSTHVTITVIVAGAIGTNGGGRGSCIGIWWDERAELGSLIMGVEFVINLFPNELCR